MSLGSRTKSAPRPFMLTVGLKFGRVSHAKDWEDVPNVLASYGVAGALGLPVVRQVGAGWSRALFGDVAVVYDTAAELERRFPDSRLVTLKDAHGPPPMA